MTWVRIDDGFISHPKTLQLSHKAIVLHLTGLTHCATHLTDGVVDKTAMRMLLATARVTKKALTELLELEMWSDQGKEYVIHDYLEYQESRATVLKRRADATDRKRRQRNMSRRDEQRDDHRDSREASQDTHPFPSHPSSILIVRDDPTSAVHNVPIEDSSFEERRQRIIDAEVSKRHRESTKKIDSDERWMNSVRKNLTAEHGADLIQTISQYPDAPDSAIAARVFHGETHNRLGEYGPRAS